MKPWRAIIKQLEAAQDTILAKVGPAPFGEFHNTGQWIRSLSFLSTYECEFVLRFMIERLSKDQSWEYSYSINDNETLRWHLLLRIECGLTFCRGKLWKRKEFNWEQPKELILKWLLRELWFEDALFWAHRTFGSPPAKPESKAEAIVKELSAYAHRHPISKN